MRDDLRETILAEAARKRAITDRERLELLAGIEHAIEAYRYDLADPEPEELGRRERIIDGLEQAIAAAIMCLPAPPFASETLALAELREDGPLLDHPSLRADPVATMLSIWRAAFDDYVEVERFFEKGRRGERQPLAGCRLPGEIQLLVLRLCAAWARNVDPALGLSADGGPNPLLRFLTAVLIEACESAPRAATLHDFVKKRARREIQSETIEADDDGVDLLIVEAVMKSPYSNV